MGKQHAEGLTTPQEPFQKQRLKTSGPRQVMKVTQRIAESKPKLRHKGIKAGAS